MLKRFIVAFLCFHLLFLLSNALPTNGKVQRSRFLWQNGIVPFSFGTGFSKDQTENILECLLEIERYTCLKFRTKEYDSVYLYFQSSDSSTACRTSVVGSPLSGRNEVTLGPGCFTKRTLYHEILHAIGLDHEHQRSDRDRYVEIVYDNIRNDHLDEFKMEPSINKHLLSVDYDYQSVMHYQFDAFAKKKNSPTLIPKFKNVTLQMLGNSETPTLNDYLKVLIIYNCPITKNDDNNGGNNKLSSTFPHHYSADEHTINLWPRGIVPYFFNDNVPSSMKTKVKEMIEMVQKKTCLRFKEAEISDVGYIEFQVIDDHSRLRSGVDVTGAIEGVKPFRLKKDSIKNERLMYFWMLVTIGMLPEVRRPDRDRYVKVIWENIGANNRPYLERYETLDSRLLSLPYDFQSVMHYRETAFASKSGEMTIIPVNKSIPLHFIASSSKPTNWDWEKINAIYNCDDEIVPFYGEKQQDDSTIEIENNDDYLSEKHRIGVVPPLGHEQPTNEGGGGVELVAIFAILAGVVVVLVGSIVFFRWRRSVNNSKNPRNRRPDGLTANEDNYDDDDGEETPSMDSLPNSRPPSALAQTRRTFNDVPYSRLNEAP